MSRLCVIFLILLAGCSTANKDVVRGVMPPSDAGPGVRDGFPPFDASASTDARDGGNHPRDAEDQFDAGSAPERVLLFAADFASGLGCGDEVGNEGCDIYRARFSDDWEILTIDQVTDDARPEAFPTLHPNGHLGYYDLFVDGPRTRSIYYVNLVSGATGVLVDNGTYPDVFPTGDALVFNDMSAEHSLAIARLDPSGTRPEEIEIWPGLRDRRDPSVAPDGNRIVYKQQMRSVEGVVAVQILELDSGRISDVVSNDTTGHCVFSGTGRYVLCDNATAGGLIGWDVTGPPPWEQELVVADRSNEELIALDPDFEECSAASVNYPAYCDDDASIIVSISCNGPLGTPILWSKLFVADVTSPTAPLRPIGMELARAFGGFGKRSWTASCRRLFSLREDS